MLIIGLLVMIAPASAQQPIYPIISAENIHNLQSAQHLDFETLPAEIVPASGLFVINSDASKVVTFGNIAGGPPLSRAILWGYGDSLIIHEIADSSIFRVLSNDGNCLYAGYQGSIHIYPLSELEAAPIVLSLNAPADFVNDLWIEDATKCDDGRLYAEITNMNGETAVWKFDMPSTTPTLAYENLFAVPNQEMAARVGRIPPPLALTMDFDGNLYQWDMTENTLTATVPIGELAMFGAINRAGTHYVWLTQEYNALHVVDFEEQSDEEVADLGDGFYISHLKLTDGADVILGVDPNDKSDTVSAWLVETGERLDLGPYRQCERSQPDLVQLSTDGTTLVIGCDTGIDIWRVVTDE